jgi:hypothetical protein
MSENNYPPDRIDTLISTGNKTTLKQLQNNITKTLMNLETIINEDEEEEELTMEELQDIDNSINRFNNKLVLIKNKIRELLNAERQQRGGRSRRKRSSRKNKKTKRHKRR